MTGEPSRCPYCESAVPREALFCARCGGKLPRGTPPDSARATPLPPPVSVSPRTRPPSARPSEPPRTSADPGVSARLSLSRVQRPSRVLRVVGLLVFAVACVGGGYVLGRSHEPAPIEAVPAPAVVELGQPRVAVGVEAPDPSRFLGGADAAVVPLAPEAAR